MISRFKTLRGRIAFLLIAANLPMVGLSVWIAKHEFADAGRAHRDRLVQAAELLAARAGGFQTGGAGPTDAMRQAIFRDRGSRGEIAAGIIARDGRPFALDDEERPYGADWLPKDTAPNTPLSDDPRILKARGADGRAYQYAVAPIKGSDARAVVAAPFDLLGRSQAQWLLLAVGFPALMILLCVGMVLFGIERFVLRWIRTLRGAAASYDGGRLDAKATSLKGAPTEIAELGDALEAMSLRVQDRSTALEAAIEERDRLLRELHHRVKNNFQMIASLLALQRHEAPESMSAALRAPEDRVRAMAAAYKVSYASGEIGHVEVSELIRDVAQQARQTTNGRSFEVAAHFPEDAGEVDLDRAVSLALLMMELLNAAAGATEKASVSASPSVDGRIALTIGGPKVAWLPTSGLSQRLIGAYADQLSTKIEQEAGGSVRISVALASEKPSIGMRPPGSATH
ncbi:sensor histidine kinase [Hansschlegelia sp. KR7-227]|uniref:sensor histidine kinase n=1 Tax=Hansschlegelia sp. KR7-227 TaxID=3400914 RepID=UPI003BFFE201